MKIDDKVLNQDIKEVISQVARIDINTISDSSSLRNDLWVDSLQGIQIMSAIEKKYNIKIQEIEIFNVDTVLDVVNLIKEYMND